MAMSRGAESAARLEPEVRPTALLFLRGHLATQRVLSMSPLGE